MIRAVIAPEPGGPEALQVVELADPEPGPGQVVLEVAAAGVNRADLLQRRGFYPPPAGESEVLGLECSGRVVAVGSGIRLVVRLVVGAPEGRGGLLLDPAQGAVLRGEQQAGPPAEAVVERAVRRARPLRDGRDGHRGEAALAEQLEGGVQHALGRRRAAVLLGGAHRSTVAGPGGRVWTGVEHAL